ncbi:hypothetical protein QF046_000305 [Microbacterium sp. W4I4]|uniref:hypothetical protein n=1 Tax=Microbacterium sp. W4I4 TaxID=3042295 RepID=UPI00277D98AD|nr:hypothetical protein [Microbacterium sp. W4I4]MDQ0612664.1 hypothetical protein [Microbacterium sp. W4I4]
MHRADLAAAFAGSDLGLRRGVVDLSPASDAWARTFAAVHMMLIRTASTTWQRGIRPTVSPTSTASRPSSSPAAATHSARELAERR